MRTKWTAAALVAFGCGLFLQGSIARGQEASPGLGGCSTPKICRPAVGTKKIDKRVYGSLNEPLCVPRCSVLALIRGHGSCCSCPVCEAPRVRKVLLIKIRKEEHHEKKCILQEMPCGTSACPCGPQAVPTIPGTPALSSPPKSPMPGEPIPAPRPDK